MRKILIILTLLALPALASPQGEFMVGEYDGEDFNLAISFQGKRAEIRSLDSDWKKESELEELGGGLYRFTVPFPDADQHVTLIELSRDEFVLASPKESKVLRGYRKRSFPRGLNGAWRLEGKEQGMVFQDSKVTLLDGKETLEGRVFPLSAEGPVHRLILHSADAPGEAILLNFVLLDQNSLLVWDDDDGDTKRFFREGWMAK